MAVENRHIERISGTRASLQTNLDNLQIAVETDSSENLVYKDDDGTYHIIPNLADNVNFANILSTGVIGFDSGTNHLAITDTYAYLLANGKKIIDYLYTNDYISINESDTAIDIILNGENAGKVGIGTIAPDAKVQAIVASASDGIEVATASGAARKKTVLTVDANFGYLDAYHVGTGALPLKIQPNESFSKNPFHPFPFSLFHCM